MGLDVSDGKGRTHVTYRGIKDGKPYTGVASIDGLGKSADETLANRYKKYGVEGAPDVKPDIIYHGEGEEGKQISRGLEEKRYI